MKLFSIVSTQLPLQTSQNMAHSISILSKHLVHLSANDETAGGILPIGKYVWAGVAIPVSPASWCQWPCVVTVTRADLCS